MFQYQVLFMLFITMLLNWLVKTEEFLAKENVQCTTSERKRLKYEYVNSIFRYNDFGLKQIEEMRKAVQCNFHENSGFTFNMIGKSLSDLITFSFQNSENFSDTPMTENTLNNFISRNESDFPLFEVSFINAQWQLLPNGFDLVFPNLNLLNLHI